MQHDDAPRPAAIAHPRRYGDTDRRRLLQVLRRQREIYDAQSSRIGVHDLLPYARKVGLDWLVHPGS